MILRLPDGYQTIVGEGGHGALRRTAPTHRACPCPLPGPVPRGARRAELESRQRRRGCSRPRRSAGSRARGGIVVVIAHRPSAIAAVDLLAILANGTLQNLAPKEEIIRQVVPAHPPGTRTTSPWSARRVARHDRLRPSPRRPPALPASAYRRGAAASGFLCFGLIGWSAQADLAGAVIAHGQLVVESSAKKIQHPTGGVVRSISVADGQKVKAGEVLVGPRRYADPREPGGRQPVARRAAGASRPLGGGARRRFGHRLPRRSRGACNLTTTRWGRSSPASARCSRRGSPPAPDRRAS